jgi:hypothetical protein
VFRRRDVPNEVGLDHLCVFTPAAAAAALIHSKPVTKTKEHVPVLPAIALGEKVINFQIGGALSVSLSKIDARV